MKKSKLNLSNLKVKSFVTNLEDDNSETVKGGNTPEWTSTAWEIITNYQFGCEPIDRGSGQPLCAA